MDNGEASKWAKHRGREREVTSSSFTFLPILFALIWLLLATRHPAWGPPRGPSESSLLTRQCLWAHQMCDRKDTRVSQRWLWCQWVSRPTYLGTQEKRRVRKTDSAKLAVAWVVIEWMKKQKLRQRETFVGCASFPSSLSLSFSLSLSLSLYSWMLNTEYYWMAHVSPGFTSDKGRKKSKS